MNIRKILQLGAALGLLAVGIFASRSSRADNGSGTGPCPQLYQGLCYTDAWAYLNQGAVKFLDGESWMFLDTNTNGVYSLAIALKSTAYSCIYAQANGNASCEVHVSQEGSSYTDSGSECQDFPNAAQGYGCH